MTDQVPIETQVRKLLCDLFDKDDLRDFLESHVDYVVIANDDKLRWADITQGESDVARIVVQEFKQRGLLNTDLRDRLKSRRTLREQEIDSVFSSLDNSLLNAPPPIPQPAAPPKAAAAPPAQNVAPSQFATAPDAPPDVRPVAAGGLMDRIRTVKPWMWIAGVAVVLVVFFLFSGGDTYGDDPALDALWDSCEEGNLVACDTLYDDSKPGSEYEEFGATCGNLGGGRFDGECASRFNP